LAETAAAAISRAAAEVTAAEVAAASEVATEVAVAFTAGASISCYDLRQVTGGNERRSGTGHRHLWARLRYNNRH